MNKEKYELLKSKFLKIIASVPDPLRDEIIVVIEEEGVVKTYTWLTASLEIRRDTARAPTILEHLEKLGVLEDDQEG